MKFKLNETQVNSRGIITKSTLTLDDGRKIDVTGFQSFHSMDFDCSDDTPLTVGTFQIQPTRIADLALDGTVINDGDEFEVTEDWIKRRM